LHYHLTLEKLQLATNKMQQTVIISAITALLYIQTAAISPGNTGKVHKNVGKISGPFHRKTASLKFSIFQNSQGSKWKFGVCIAEGRHSQKIHRTHSKQKNC